MGGCLLKRTESLSNPRRNSIEKNMLDQNCGAGSCRRHRLKEVKSSALSLIFDHTDLWICDEGESLSSLSHSLHQDAEDMGGVVEGGEHHNGGQE